MYICRERERERGGKEREREKSTSYPRPGMGNLFFPDIFQAIWIFIT